MKTLLSNLLVPVVTIVGLFVLIALNKVSADTALPLISGLAGVHLGVGLPTPTMPTTTPATTTSPGGNPSPLPPGASVQ